MARFTDLPLEIVLCIVEDLWISETCILSLTCKSLYHSHALRRQWSWLLSSWDPNNSYFLERHYFLALLIKDLPKHRVCKTRLMICPRWMGRFCWKGCKRAVKVVWNVVKRGKKPAKWGDMGMWRIYLFTACYANSRSSAVWSCGTQPFPSQRLNETLNSAYGMFLVCQQPVNLSVTDQYYRSCSLYRHGMGNQWLNGYREDSKGFTGWLLRSHTEANRKDDNVWISHWPWHSFRNDLKSGPNHRGQWTPLFWLQGGWVYNITWSSHILPMFHAALSK